MAKGSETEGLNQELVRFEGNKDLVRLSSLFLKKSGPLLARADALVVASKDDYQRADSIALEAKEDGELFTGPMEELIRPRRKELDSLYAIQRYFKQPFEEARTVIKEKMKKWYLEDQARERRELEERRRADEELERQRLKALADLEAAKTSKQAEKMAEKVIAIEEKQEEVAERAVERVVSASNSQARKVMKWRVKDMDAVLVGVLEGTVPKGAVVVDSAYVNGRFRAAKGEVAMWSGFEVYEDVQIASR